MITVRFFAAAREVVGSSQEEIDVETLDQLIEVFTRENARAKAIFEQCSYLLDGGVAHSRGAQLANVKIVDVLPPFAGG